MVRLHKNKKGNDEWVSWVMNIIFIVITVAILLSITNKAIARKLDTKNLEYSLLVSRVVNNQLCLAYQDKDTLRVYPGIIDTRRITDDATLKEVLESCLQSSDIRPLGMNVTLTYIDGTKKLSAIAYQENYEDMEPLSFSQLYVKETRQILVIMDDNGKRETGLLTISLVGERR